MTLSVTSESRGFSLVELAVGIGILALILGLAFGLTRMGRDQRSSADQLAFGARARLLTESLKQDVRFCRSLKQVSGADGPRLEIEPARASNLEGTAPDPASRVTYEVIRSRRTVVRQSEAGRREFSFEGELKREESLELDLAVSPSGLLTLTIAPSPRPPGFPPVTLELSVPPSAIASR